MCGGGKERTKESSHVVQFMNDDGDDDKLLLNAVHCSEDLSGQRKGAISSPSWPSTYAMNADCLYTLSVEEHLQVELHFSDGFDVEQSTDGNCVDALMVTSSLYFVQSAKSK